MATVPTPTHYGKKLVGPFRSRDIPVREGLYVRVSAKTGNLVFSYYHPNNGWSAYATCPERAMELRHKRTRKTLTTWYGFARA